MGRLPVSAPDEKLSLVMRDRFESETYLLDRRGMMLRGRYEVLELIGTGGMGSVWIAEQLALRREVVVKFHEDWSSGHRSKQAIDRFVREAELLASVRHRNVTELYEVGRSDEGEPFLIMEKLEGHALSYLMRGGDLIPLEEAFEIAIAIAAGLEAVHAAGILHRDVKPENIFLHEDREDESVVPKLLDFGLAGTVQAAAALTGSKHTVGTPGYMSSEQARGVEGLDGRADVYGLAVTLYEMLTAELPTRGTTGQELVQYVANHDPTPITNYRPDLAGSPADVIMCGLARVRDERPADAREFRLRLEEIREDRIERGAWVTR